VQRFRTGLAGGLWLAGALVSACVLPSFDPTGKQCSASDPCPSPWLCLPSGSSQPNRCARTDEKDGGPDGSSGRWLPKPGTTWQIQRTGTLDTSVDASVFAIDLFATGSAEVASLKAAGRKLLCLFSGGVGHPSEPGFDALPPATVGNATSDRPTYKWLDVRDASVRSLMVGRLDAAIAKGCDAVSPTYVDGFQADTGFNLTAQHYKDFLRALVTEAHARTLSLGLENAVELAGDLAADLDFARNEQCVRFSECASLGPFTQREKAVFHVEYRPETALAQVCAVTSPLRLSTILKNQTLDAWRLACP
jgi:Glycoside-hydrolase family GH114